MKTMFSRYCAFALLLGAMGLSPGIARGQNTSQKKLIEMGWNMPKTSTLPRDLAKLEASPFDGVILSAIGWEGKDRLDLYKLFWGVKEMTKPQFQSAVDNLKATPFKRLTDNFLRLNVGGGNVDWFDDAGWRVIISNAELAAWICKEGNLKGILFDTEQYQNKVFSYRDRPQNKTRGFEEYSDQAQRRGRELSRAITAIKPDAVLFFTYATSLLPVKKVKDPTGLTGAPYGLLPAFIDGMLEGADPRATFCDGMESSYTFRDQSEFSGLKTTAREARILSRSKSLYDSRMTYGYGLWLDSGGAQYKWDPDKPDQNFFTPAAFQCSLERALQATDKYVWIYSQKVNWWTGEGMSPVYLNAIKEARQKAGLP